jgi:hypothetical protein
MVEYSMTPDEEALIRRRAAELHSDGCSGPTEVFHICCLAHDIAYRTGADHFDHPITRREADARFRRCMQSRSPVGRFSPTAWFRWVLVRIFGRGRAW